MPNGSYAAVIEKLRPGAAEPGEIVHLDGRVLGRHEGVIRYTVGQRRGLGIGGGEPLFVVRLDAGGAAGGRRAARGAGAADRAGRRGELARRRRPSRTAPAERLGGRGAGALDPAAEAGAACIRAGRDRAEVELLAPEEGVAPGQACVFYAPEGSRVLGGGWIVRG